MKTILVLTDFSINADYAAHYALQLAQKIEANLLLCNVYRQPDEPMAKQGAWPLGAIEENSINDLSELACRLNTLLDKEPDGKKFRPEINQCNKEGLLTNMINDIAFNNKVLMAVVSMHSSNFWSVNHTSDIIEKANFPVLVIPYQVRFQDYKTIAFATNMKSTDINVFESLSGLAKYADSEILITYVAAEISDEIKEENTLRQFFNQIPYKINYSQILYRIIKNRNVKTGLKWLTTHIDIDLLVLVHRRRNFFEKIFAKSVAQKLAMLTNKPLLIFPCSAVLKTLPVF